MSILVFKILKPSSTFHGIDYNERKKSKEKAALLYFNNFMHLQEGAKAISRKDAKGFMDWWCSSNTRIRNKQFHAILSCKGKSIELNRLKDYGLEIMNHLGYKDNPVLVYGHNDTQHNHIHIITPRIDADGKKISHHFEKKRANQILNDILDTDYSKEVKKDIDQVLSYHCSTLAQYKLLFEQKGYDTRSEGQNLHLYKYGTHQSALALQKINDCVNQPFNIKQKQISALLHKYKRQYSAKLYKEDSGKYTTKKKALQSDLTRFLQQKFGLEFIFFTGKSHQIPYGYVIIDHQHKAVYKGSELMPLQTLLTSTAPDIDNNHPDATRKSIKDQEAQNQQFPISSNKYVPGIPIESLINNIENDVERDVYKEEHSKKRKKGRFI